MTTTMMTMAMVMAATANNRDCNFDKRRVGEQGEQGD